MRLIPSWPQFPQRCERPKPSERRGSLRSSFCAPEALRTVGHLREQRCCVSEREVSAARNSLTPPTLACSPTLQRGDGARPRAAGQRVSPALAVRRGRRCRRTSRGSVWDSVWDSWRSSCVVSGHCGTSHSGHPILARRRGSRLSPDLRQSCDQGDTRRPLWDASLPAPPTCRLQEVVDRTSRVVSILPAWGTPCSGASTTNQAPEKQAIAFEDQRGTVGR